MLLSKNARKRLAKQQERRQRKEQRKAERRAARPDDSPQERDEAVEMSEEAKARREERRLMKEAGNAAFVAQCAMGMTLAIDCDFESLMKDTELNSLGQQLMFCYGSNKRAAAPATLQLVGLKDRGVLHDHLLNIAGFERWLGAHVDDRKLEDICRSEASTKDRLVYLTADADEELSVLDPNVIYVVGGIVDRNRHKGITARKAAELGIKTARFPIGPGKPLVITNCSKVLTVNHVVEIMLQVQATGRWSDAAKLLPDRKTTTTIAST